MPVSSFGVRSHRSELYDVRISYYERIRNEETDSSFSYLTNLCVSENSDSRAGRLSLTKSSATSPWATMRWRTCTNWGWISSEFALPLAVSFLDKLVRSIYPCRKRYSSLHIRPFTSFHRDPTNNTVWHLEIREQTIERTNSWLIRILVAGFNRLYVLEEISSDLSSAPSCQRCSRAWTILIYADFVQ